MNLGIATEYRWYIPVSHPCPMVASKLRAVGEKGRDLQQVFKTKVARSCTHDIDVQDIMNCYSENCVRAW